MSKHLGLLFIAVLSLLSLISFGRDIITLDKGWKFTKGDPANAALVDFDDSGWRDVSIPHVWAIEGPFDAMLPANTGKLPWKDVAWYRKDFPLEENLAGKCVYILFDGVMAFPEVYVNGQLAGRWDYGYNSFYLDITDLVSFDDPNLLALKVDTREFDSRWYPGAGIYRKVQLIVVDPVHLGIWETYIQTPLIENDSALVHLYTTVENHSNSNREVVLKSTLLGPDGETVASERKSLQIKPGGSGVFEQWLTVAEPRRWDTEDPARYTLLSEVSSQQEVTDRTRTKFGLRTFRYTADDGFWLNGRRVQFKGVNLHHDHGPLGAKFYPAAMERQLLIMKGMGVNAVRNSHNVAAPEMLEMCDSLGLLFFNEVFDKWDAKAAYLPDMDFEAFAERNIHNWVKRDRNHPCVILWSVGNEMGDIQYNIDGGFDKLNTMISLVRKYDPTRPVTMVCDSKGSAKWRHFDYYDVHAWNYGRRYLPARSLEPGKSVIISESASTLSTRGFYELPLPQEKTDFTQSLQVSSYDLNAPEWAEVADDDFMWQEEDTYVAGEFVWTGFDYLGEPTPYNDEAVKEGFITREQSAKSSYFGIVDLCGIPKDRYYLYKSHWKPEETTVHILPHWNWEDSGYAYLPVFVYTNGDCAELFLNGRSLGKKCKKPESDHAVERYRLMWMDVAYEPGELKAVAYASGEKIGETIRQTTGDPFRLRLTPERTTIHADGKDLSFILVEAVDREGNICPLADNLVRFELNGPGVVEGVGNGNPQSLEPFIAMQRELFYGKAMVIIRNTGEPGVIQLKASANGIKKASLKINAE
ncbi:MAG: glycoside hydrolase family 2 TIM barrel-domain containing protein [bacterium]